MTTRKKKMKKKGKEKVREKNKRKFRSVPKTKTLGRYQEDEEEILWVKEG